MWTRRVGELLAGKDPAALKTRVAALVRQGYSGEEALALSLMPGDPQAFLSGGFNDMLQSKDVLTDAALRVLGPRVYGGMERVSAGSTGAAMSSGTGRAALPGSVLSPGTTPRSGRQPKRPA